ncbi:cyanophycin synthetase [Dickeya dadantii]|uniref:cyanophycin synthetase n=1 Tax=Dickeya dadantii TaxID=204038 RepID=UPI00039A69A5|nr:cyanophycin synthetase [Dickeya dadantii]NPE54032.1 cyanophycin synthetase [Dickeya dadantii]NPE68715.1 cyanophycin synthetase [Dickeya dadantii]
MNYPFVSALLSEIAPTLGIQIEFEPEFNFVGEIIFPDGKTHLFKNTNLNLNPSASSAIARDKFYTKYLLQKKGFNVPRGKTFFSKALNKKLARENRRGIEDAAQFAGSLGLPVFVKPNNLSQGAGVTKVYEMQSMSAICRRLFSRTDVLLVEQECQGRDYRVVVLGDTVISAYERFPLAVYGDGNQTVQQLLVATQHTLPLHGRPSSQIDPRDPRIDIKLADLGLNRKTILPAGQKTFLLDNANLSTGGTSVDITDAIHHSFAALAIAATESLGLRLAGVDIICHDLSTDAGAQLWNIIEINSVPGLNNYAALGPHQLARVKALYRAILLQIQQDNAIQKPESG